MVIINIDDLSDQLKTIHNLSKIKIIEIAKKLQINTSGTKKQILERLDNYKKYYKYIKPILLLITVFITYKNKNVLKKIFSILLTKSTDKFISLFLNIFFNKKSVSIAKTILVSISKSNSKYLNFINFIDLVMTKTDITEPEILILVNNVLTDKNISYQERYAVVNEFYKTYNENKNNNSIFKIIEKFLENKTITDFLIKIN